MNPNDPNAGVPAADPSAPTAPVTDAPMGGTTYTPPAEPAPLGDQPTPEAPVETPAPLGDQPTPLGDQPTPLGDQPTPGAPVV